MFPDPSTIPWNGNIIMHRYERVVCRDGFTVSIQASETNYSEPRETHAERYTSVELGFPSRREELIIDWAEDQDRPTETVYGYVPVQTVNLMIAKHGGIIAGEVPPGVTPLYCEGYEK